MKAFWLAIATLAFIDVPFSSGQVELAQASRELVHDLNDKVPLKSARWLFRPDAITWHGRSLELPVIRVWRESLRAELTRFGAGISEKAADTDWRLLADVSDNAGVVALTLMVQRRDDKAQQLTFQRAVPAEPLKELLQPQADQVARYLIQSLDRQNHSFAVAVRCAAPRPAPGAVPRELVGWLEGELIQALAQAQAMHPVPAGVNNPDAHQLEIRYEEEGKNLRLTAAVGAADQAAWARSTVLVPVASLPVAITRVYFPKAVAVAWEASKDPVEAWPESELAETLAAALAEGNVRVLTRGENARAAYRLSAHLVYQEPSRSSSNSGVNRGTAILRGQLQCVGTSQPSRAWEVTVPVYTRPSAEGLPSAAIPLLASEGAQAIFRALAGQECFSERAEQ